MNTARFLLQLFVMAGVTYLVRMTPLVAVRTRIPNTFLVSFLHYIPYAVLAAMTFPAVFRATGSVATAAIGAAVAVVLSFLKMGLVGVALCACAAVYLSGFLF